MRRAAAAALVQGVVDQRNRKDLGDEGGVASWMFPRVVLIIRGVGPVGC